MVDPRMAGVAGQGSDHSFVLSRLRQSFAWCIHGIARSHDQDVVLERHVRMHGVLEGLDTRPTPAPHPPHTRPTQGLQTIFFMTGKSQIHDGSAIIRLC